MAASAEGELPGHHSPEKVRGDTDFYLFTYSLAEFP